MTTPFVGTASGDGWRSWDRVNVEVDATGAARLARDPTPTYVDSEPVGTLPSPVEAVDVGVTPLGELYALGRDRETRRPGLYRYVPDDGTLWRVPCFDDPGADETPETVLTDPRALCVTADTLYVADGSGSLHAVSIHAYQHRWVAVGAAADPVALATDGERTFLLDRGDGTDGSVGRVLPDGSTGVVRGGLAGTRDLSVAPDGALVVLLVTEGSATVERFAPDGSDVMSLGGVPLPAATSLVAGADGAVLVGGTDAAGGRTLARYRPDTGRFETVLGTDARWVALERVEPDGEGSADRYGVTTDGGELRRLEAARLTRPHPASGTHEGWLERRFDTGEPGTEWYRLALEGVLSGPATAVGVRYHASDVDREPEPLESIEGIGPTRAERLRAAGVSTPTDLAGLSPSAVAAGVGPSGGVSSTEAAAWIDAAAALAPAWIDLEPAGTADALVEGAAGRYLHVRVGLVGDPSASPALRAFRAYFDRDSYLEYLPAVYREDERGAAFLGRFLAAFETAFEGVETTLDASGHYFDPVGAPDDGLSWLAGWVGVEAEAAWPVAATRELIERADEFHRRRGTPDGLLGLVDTYVRHAAGSRSAWSAVNADPAGDGAPDGGDDGGDGDDGATPEHHLSLLEHPDLDVIGEPDAREPFERLLGGPGRFLVLLHAALDGENERAVDRLVDGSTPAHTNGEVVHLRDRFRLDEHTYLGINAVLTDPEFRVERSALGVDTTLEEREPAAQAALRARLDEGSRLA